MKNVTGLTKIVLLQLFVCLFFSLPGSSQEPRGRPERFSFAIVNAYPHDPMAFTQGLDWDEGFIYEGSGKYGGSSLRRVDLLSGKIKQKIDYGDDIFAEGITIYQDRIFQLTWKNNIIFEYNKHDFSLITSHQYPREGWGITHDNMNLIVSDGTSTLYFLDPETMTEKRRVSVRDSSDPIHYLNELEYINGSVYANIWKFNRIAIINPNDGIVEGWIDLAGLDEHLHNAKGADVLNGIMYDQEKNRLFVTGKLWDTLYEIALIPNPD